MGPGKKKVEEAGRRAGGPKVIPVASALDPTAAEGAAAVAPAGSDAAAVDAETETQEV